MFLPSRVGARARACVYVLISIFPHLFLDPIHQLGNEVFWRGMNTNDSSYSFCAGYRAGQGEQAEPVGLSDCLSSSSGADRHIRALDRPPPPPTLPVIMPPWLYPAERRLAT